MLDTCNQAQRGESQGRILIALLRLRSYSGEFRAGRPFWRKPQEQRRRLGPLVLGLLLSSSSSFPCSKRSREASASQMLRGG